MKRLNSYLNWLLVLIRVFLEIKKWKTVRTLVGSVYICINNAYISIILWYIWWIFFKLRINYIYLYNYAISHLIWLIVR